ncbi:hypothetical protein ZTR_10680 [Talaromyces verruculosus]|nr:hypothetical protein ZTR_10680 [Talaromyces verruculosus]
MPPEEGEVGDGRRGDAGETADDASNTSEAPGAPTTRRHTSRVLTKPVLYSQEQEKEALEKTNKKSGKNGKSKDLDMAELQKILQHLVESNGALRHHVMQMAQELGKRDQEAQTREIQHRNAILALQSDMNALKSQMNATQKELQETRQMITSRTSGDSDKDSEPQEINKLRKEVSELTELVRKQHEDTSISRTSQTTVSMGNTWASNTTPSSALSPATRTARVDMGLPMLRLETSQASAEAMALLQDPIQLQRTIAARLGLQNVSEAVRIEGVKTAPRNIVKVFVDREQGVKLLRERSEWLQALHGVKIQGEQWHPIKLDEVRKTDVYDASGQEKNDFREKFSQNNGGTEIRMIRWLSGGKAYGSMVVYLAKENDAKALLNRRLVNVGGEVVFSEVFRYQLRPTRCHNCQQYGHKAARCRNPTTCERCTGPHVAAHCNSEHRRCASCQKDGHGASDRQCDTWIREMEKANLRKGPQTQLSLLNDITLRNFDLLLISEPSLATIDGKVTLHSHHKWTPILPSTQWDPSTNLAAHRSMIWANHNGPQATPIPMDSPDVTAVIIKVSDYTVLIMSVYIPPRANSHHREDLTAQLQTIESTIIRVKEQYGPQIELVIAGDFNRWHHLWGGSQATVDHPQRRYEAEPILDFMSEWNLQSLLRRGTITFEGSQGRSTVDLTLASGTLAAQLIQCKIHPVEHGSDHRAIQTTFDVNSPHTATQVPRLCLNDVDWDTVCTRLEHLHQEDWSIHDSDDLNRAVGRLLNQVTQTVKDLCTETKPSPYYKRWWTEDLTALRREYTGIRNLHSQARKYGIDRPDLEELAQKAKQKFHTAIRDQKKKHWKEFLQDTDNVWKAAKYMSGNGGRMPIPALQNDGETIEDDADKARAFLATFFPPLPPIPEPPVRMHFREHVAAAAKKGFRAALGLKRLRGLTPDTARQLFMAMVTPTVDYAASVWCSFTKHGTVAPWIIRSFNPIQRSATQAIIGVYRYAALAIAESEASIETSCIRLRKHIYRHWINCHTLPLTHPFWECRRLASYQTVGTVSPFKRFSNFCTPPLHMETIQPGAAHPWKPRIRQFIEQIGEPGEYQVTRAATPEQSRRRIVIYTHGSLKNGNLSIGLVIQVNGSTSDCWSMTVGREDQLNLYYAQLGAIYEAVNYTNTIVSNLTIPASTTWTTIVTSNLSALQSLAKPRYQSGQSLIRQITDGILRIAETGMNTNLQWLSSDDETPGLQHAIRLSRQATPPENSNLIPRSFNPIQRSATQAIIGVYRYAALAIAESEASIETSCIRLRKHIYRHWINCHTLPLTHPFWECRRLASYQTVGTVSPFKRFSNFCTPPLHMETIQPGAAHPWKPRIRQFIEQIGETGEYQVTRAATPEQSRRRIVIYTHGSLKNGNLSIGLVIQVNGSTTDCWSMTVGREDQLNLYYAQLGAIYEAVNYTNTIVSNLTRPASTTWTTIVTSNLSALQSLAKPRYQSGQSLIRQITDGILRITETGMNTNLQWLSSDDETPGLQHAIRLSRQATPPENSNLIPRWAKTCLKSALWRITRARLEEQGREEFRQGKHGLFTVSLDSALPGKHTRRLYEGLTRSEASALAQLRTGCSRLNQALFQIKRSEDDQCLVRKAQNPRNTFYFIASSGMISDNQ